jgi:hypothetical protein
MNKLSLRDWSSFAEVVASVAVVISLIFVAYSVNQNTRIMQATHDSQIFNLQDSIIGQLSADPVLASILVKLEQKEELTPSEAKQWEWHLYRWVSLWEMAYNRHEDGLMSDQHWKGWDRAFVIFVLDSETGMTEDFWQVDRETYSEGFAAHVDAAFARNRQDRRQP